MSTAALLGELITTEKTERQELSVRTKDYREITEELQGLLLESDDDYEYAAVVLKQVKTYYKEIDARRKKVTEPLNAALSEFRSWYSPALKSLEEAETILKRKMGEFALQKERQREEAMKAIAAASKQGDFEAAYEASQNLVEAPQVKGITQIAEWEYTIEDLSQVPREYLTLDHSAVRIYLKRSGSADDPIPVPGLKFTKKVSLRARA